jgi:YtcA family
MLVRKFGKICLTCLVMMSCAGCSRAPSIEVIGSFFPGWMFCIVGALGLTGLIRTALVRREMEPKLGPLVVFYPGLAVALSCLLWLVFFS